MRALVFAALAVAVMVGLWYLMQPAPPAPAPIADAAAPVPPPPPPAPQRFSLTVPGEGAQLLRVRQGDEVELTVTSARADELHLHGYDLTLELRANEPAMLAFTAEHAGRFEIELHHGHAELGVLEVTPR